MSDCEERKMKNFARPCLAFAARVSDCLRECVEYFLWKAECGCAAGGGERRESQWVGFF